MEKDLNSKRYWWLRLKEDFFEQDEIKIIESMPNGKEYIIFYMKLMLKSMNDKGALLFKNTIPYTPQMLSTITNTNIDIVKVAVDTFIALELMEKLDDGTLFIQAVNSMVGSETEYAQKKREYREKQKINKLEDKTKTLSETLSEKKKTMSQKKGDNVRQEIEIELDIEKEYISPIVPLCEIDPKAELEKMKRRSEGSYQIWQILAEEQGVEFAHDEWNAIRGLAMANPKLQAFQITAMIIQLHDWAQQGLDIKQAILDYTQKAPGRFNSLRQPFMKKATDAKGNPIYGQAIVEQRLRIIEHEKSLLSHNKPVDNFKTGEYTSQWDKMQ